MQTDLSSRCELRGKGLAGCKFHFHNELVQPRQAYEELWQLLKGRL